MKHICVILLCLMLLFGCAAPEAASEKQYSATFLDYFDTVTTVVGKAESEEAFKAKVQPLKNELEYYHRLFDIYNSYDGVNNLKTVNDCAAKAPVKVDRAILELISDCKRYCTATDGLFNPAMGSVLSLWHKYREDGISDPANAMLPTYDELKEAALHTDPEDIVLDYDASTVFFTDSELKLDVGGIAKGWTVEHVKDSLPKGLLISVGGNIYATGPKDSGGTPWSVGVRDPEEGDDAYLNVLSIKGGSVVTSGSYIRTYSVDGKSYHHIIDPRTLYPGELWVSVTVVCDDSALADVLSTTLFLLGLDEGKVLLEEYGAEAMWVDSEGNEYFSESYQSLIRK